MMLLAAIVYLSWKPSPSIIQVPWIPAPIGCWFDHHDWTKNMLGFGTLAFASFMAWAVRTPCPAATTIWRRPRRATEAEVLACCFALVVALELGQLALPKRTCDWRDVLAGWAGGIVAWSLFRLLRSDAG